MSEQYTRYKGILFPSFYCTMESLSYAENEFQVRDDDIFIVTYPKSGTNWMIEILSLILKNGDPTWCQTVLIYDRSPWYEVCITKEILENNCSQRLITSHLPIHLFAKSFYNSKAKVVYVARDPRDTLVSLHYFYHISVFLKDPENFQESLENFLKGEEVEDHVRYHTYSTDTVRRSIVLVWQTDVLHLMKELKCFLFFETGVSGDWKNHFTVAQSELFDAVYKERMKDINMKFIWD
ncbi:sulfotransferase 2B1-like [Protopterus annectens]|uniref:sulfotransferase 2B1-like n=1 Tax=Protopterus annectens TaxID=7888 RepID=UPI001CFADD45|nr:sulfotransferase 2B1-like [Protopterus annectens]